MSTFTNTFSKSLVQQGSNTSVPVLHPPIVSLPTQTEITDVSATVGATLDCNKLETVWSIEYGATTAYGSTQAGGTTSVNGAKTVSLTGLAQSSAVHWRFKAVNSDGTTYSSDQTLQLNYVASSYNLSGSLAYTVINKTLASTGDSIEIKARGLSTLYSPDLTFFANPNVAYNRFAWYSANQMQLRITGQTTVYWTVTGINVNDFNVYKLVRTATGYELFINGTSFGVQVNAGTFVCYSIGGSAISSSVGKWEIEYCKSTISSTETMFSNLYANGASVNVVKSEYNLSALSKVYVLKQLNPIANVPTRLHVYLQLKDERYQHYTVDNEYNEATYVNYWRLTKGMIAIRTFTNSSFFDSLVMNLFTGESELALQEAGKSDATGGYHGNERIDIQAGDGALFYLDNALTDITAFSTSVYSAATAFKYEVKSSIHRREDASHTLLANHTKTTTISGKGFITDNVVTLDYSESLWVYTGIACIGKDTAKYVANENLVYIEMLADSGEKLITTNPPLRELHGYNATTKLQSFVTSKLFDTGDDVLGTHYISDRINDSKYYRRTPLAVYNVGKVWHSEMKVEFDIYP